MLFLVLQACGYLQVLGVHVQQRGFALASAQAAQHVGKAHQHFNRTQLAARKACDGGQAPDFKAAAADFDTTQGFSVLVYLKHSGAEARKIV